MRQRLRDDSGIAMMMALGVMTVVLILMMVAANIAITSNRDSGRDRQRLTAVDAAEAGIDAMYAKLASSGPVVPCNDPATGAVLTKTLAAASDQPTYIVSVHYYDATGAEMTCPNDALNPPSTALIRSTVTEKALAGANQTRRALESVTRLTPIRDKGFNKAIYGYSGINLQNNTSISGSSSGVNDADLYTAGDFICTNKQSYGGRVIAGGSIYFGDPNGTAQGTQCTTQGDVWAGGVVKTTTTSTVGGNVLAAGGNATLSSNTSVTNNVKATGTVSWSGCTSSKCFSGAVVNPPPTQPFPRMCDNCVNSNGVNSRDEWSSGGFTNIVDANGCSASDDTNPVVWIKNHASSMSAPTQLHTSCAMTFDSDPTLKTISLNKNLAIFAAGGFSSSQQKQWTSTSSTQRKLYWIVPYNAAYAPPSANPCNAPGINTSQQFSTSSTVTMMLYAQGPITFNNNGTQIGQIYSQCTVTIQNQFNLQYNPLPVFGVEPTSMPVQGYQVDIVYKRETL